MAEYLEPIIDQVVFEPKFVSWSCPSCDSDYKRKNCMSDGKYCAMQHSEKLELAGQEILLEDLRQWCIFQNSRDLPLDQFVQPGNIFKYMFKEPSFYFEYVKITHEICRNRITTECANIAIETLGILPDVIEKCLMDTFEGPDPEEDDNLLFHQFTSEWQEQGVGLYPGVVINGKTFRGRMTPDNVFEAVCAAFQTEPKSCRIWQDKMSIPIPVGQSTGINQLTLLYIVLAMLLVNVSIILGYRHYLIRELKRDMDVQVKSAVS